jgi:exodeoxyribonuclease V alpha subunit
MTIHKSQGSEFPVCIIGLPEHPKNMLVRNLLYTGVTRAKKKVILVACRGSLSTAIRTNQTGTRRTGLLQRRVQEGAAEAA